MPRAGTTVDERIAELRARKAGQRPTPIGQVKERLRPVQSRPEPLPKLPTSAWRGGGPSRTRLIQSTRKARFLEAFAEIGIIGPALEQAGIAARSTLFKWLEHDEQFAFQYRQAEQASIERLEEEARRRAVDGTAVERTAYYRGQAVGSDVRTEYSDGLLTMLLRAKAPEKYRERLDLQVAQVIKAVAGFDPLEVLGTATHS